MARTLTALDWRPITEPYLHGERCTLGNRQVEVVQTEPGSWAVFRYIGGEMIREQRTDTSHGVAKREAADWLRSLPQPEWWFVLLAGREVESVPSEPGRTAEQVKTSLVERG